MNTATDIYMMPTCIHKHKCLWRMYLRVDFLDHRAYVLLTVLDNPNLFSKLVLTSTPTSMSRAWVSPLFPFSPVCGVLSSVSGTSVSIHLITEKVKHFPTYLLAIWNSSLVKLKCFLSFLMCSLFVCKNPMMFYILYAFIGNKPFSHVASLYDVQTVL